ncbi:MAG: hypothetical protein COV35_01615 [Alphaproteobacteria bacterium CG11_big_fil_rev_8_21_14_0_20_39_49]|nr:MAG: hypothetical protein COV35_01615 [Alphaproteobacteria bacterium CG11_big_fil_rev_8_21_14_0_20_39_49]
MLNKNKILKVLVITAALNSPSITVANENLIDKDVACFELSGQLQLADYFIKSAVELEMLDENMLVEVGASIAEVSPMESIGFYSSQKKHLKKTYDLLGCSILNEKTN